MCCNFLGSLLAKLDANLLRSPLPSLSFILCHESRTSLSLAKSKETFVKNLFVDTSRQRKKIQPSYNSISFHQRIQVPNLEVLYIPYNGVLGGGDSLTQAFHTAYICEYFHYRYLKMLVTSQTHTENLAKFYSSPTWISLK